MIAMIWQSRIKMVKVIVDAYALLNFARKPTYGVYTCIDSMLSLFILEERKWSKKILCKACLFRSPLVFLF